jgi:hypothetical protein
MIRIPTLKNAKWRISANPSIYLDLSAQKVFLVCGEHLF